VFNSNGCNKGQDHCFSLKRALRDDVTKMWDGNFERALHVLMLRVLSHGFGAKNSLDNQCCAIPNSLILTVFVVLETLHSVDFSTKMPGGKHVKRVLESGIFHGCVSSLSKSCWLARW